MSSRTKATGNQTRKWPALRRATRLGQAAILVGAGVIGASCVDGARPMGPLSPFGIGSKMKYDSVAPMELKNAARLRTLSASAARFRPQVLTSASRAEGGFAATPIPFAPEPGPFKNLFIECEDCLLGMPDETGAPLFDASGTPIPFPIGFKFTYFGNTYDSFYFSTNGFITFSHNYNGCCEGYVIPTDDAVNDVIAIAWGDLSPRWGQASFETRGTEPNRKLIVNLNEVELFAEPDVKVTAQLILYEGTNVVELHTRSQDQSAWQRTTQGIENATGTVALWIDGRNSDYYSLSNDAVRFAPPAGSNSAPSVDAGSNASDPAPHYRGQEGSAITFRATGKDVDGDALTYSWDFNGDGSPDADGAEATYSYDDDGAYTARVTVTDSHGHSASAAVDVIVENVKPTVVVEVPESVNEGSQIVISVVKVADPSAADRAAGFQFAYDCGEGFGEFGPTAGATCTAVDNGVRAVGVKVRDRNGGESVVTKQVTINNVAPTVETSGSLTVQSGDLVSLTGRFTDPGVVDKTWKWTFASNLVPSNANLSAGRAGSAAVSGEATEQGVPVTGTYPACGAGQQVLTLSVVDKDGGRGEATVTINVERRAVDMTVKPRVVAYNNRDRDDDSDSDDSDGWNDDAGRLVTVHLLSTPSFDATKIDPATVRVTNGVGKGTPVAKKRKNRRGAEEWLVTTAYLNLDRMKDVKISFSRAALIANGDLTKTTDRLSLVGRVGGCAEIVGTGSVAVK